MGVADQLAQMKAEKAAANLKAGQDFLAQNKTRPEVTTLESGLQYEVLTAGVGEKPLAHNEVTCHYHGTLIDGTIFDSSVQRGQPASFPLNMVIICYLVKELLTLILIFIFIVNMMKRINLLSC